MFQFEFFSTSLREAEQKLTAAVPTGTGPDIYDIGTNISVNFIDNGLIDPNPPEIDAYRAVRRLEQIRDRLLHDQWQNLWVAAAGGQPRMRCIWNKAYFNEAGIAGPPKTFPELIDAAKKLAKIDSQGRMTRSGISLRLSGQGSGIGEKWRYVVEAAGGSMIEPTPSGKWHNGYDNQAGRDALTFYVDAVQTWHIDDPKVPHDADAFSSGATAMLFREAWVIGDIQAKNPKLDYGVVPIPAWKAGDPRMMMLQPWGVYVNGQSNNKAAAWDFMKFLTNAPNGLTLTEMTGWLSPRQDIDWKPLLAKTPQFEAFVSPPPDVKFYVEPVLTAFDEIETRLSRSPHGGICRSVAEGQPAEGRRGDPRNGAADRPDPEGCQSVRHGLIPRDPAEPARQAVGLVLCDAATDLGALCVCAHRADRLELRAKPV